MHFLVGRNPRIISPSTGVYWSEEGKTWPNAGFSGKNLVNKVNKKPLPAVTLAKSRVTRSRAALGLWENPSECITLHTTICPRGDERARGLTGDLRFLANKGAFTSNGRFFLGEPSFPIPVAEGLEQLVQKTEILSLFWTATATFGWKEWRSIYHRHRVDSKFTSST